MSLTIGYIQRETFNGGKDTVIFQKEVLCQEGQLAAALAEKFAVVACIEDGEDSGGRQKLRLQTPEECAKRSCDIARSLFNEFRERGLVLDIPAPVEPKPKATS